MKNREIAELDKLGMEKKSKKTDPIFIEKESQRMAVITTKGDPNEVMEKVMLGVNSRLGNELDGCRTPMSLKMNGQAYGGYLFD